MEWTLFSQTTEYALRAVICLASQTEASMKTQDIAEITQVSSGYLSKVLQTLGRAGIVSSQRGLYGGFRLARPADEITIFEVVDAVEPLGRIHTCPLGLGAHGKNLCSLHRKLDDAYAGVELALRSSTVAQILADENPSKPLCSLPKAQADLLRATDKKS